MKKVKVGIVGCGTISSIYLKNCTEMFKILEVTACADIVIEKAQEKANEYNVPKACSVEELLADPEIDIVLNLTIPKVHAEVCLAALNAGKHVYVEKPLAVTREDGQKILDKAREKGLLVGSAPDTFLGASLQTCRKLLDDGWIGEPVALTAFMLGMGPEGWHPDPEFYYKPGGGPLFDMGPYYLSAMVALLGPVNRVTASARISFPERTITSELKYGTKIKVDVPTHIAGVIDFKSGVVGTLVTSFDVWDAQVPFMEIYGSEGTLSIPDPNYFGGPVKVRRFGEGNWSEIPLVNRFSDNSRGIGLADMAYAIISGRKHRANGEMAYHVLDIMEGFHIASKGSRHYYPESTCDRPEPLPVNFPHSEGN